MKIETLVIKLPANAERLNGADALKKSRFTDGDHYELSFADYFFRMVYEHAAELHHHKKDERADPVGTQLKWRYIRGIWSTYGKLDLAFYSVPRRQIRARIHFSPNLADVKKYSGQTKIGWHMDETPVVLPAILQSLNMMSFAPLNGTRLFDFEFPEEVDEFSAWSRKGDRAERVDD